MSYRKTYIANPPFNKVRERKQNAPLDFFSAEICQKSCTTFENICIFAMRELMLSSAMPTHHTWERSCGGSTWRYLVTTLAPLSPL